MATQAKVGTFSLNTSTGNQSVTGVGFQPELVIFLGSEQTADGLGEDLNHFISFGKSSTERVCMTANDESVVGFTDNSRSIIGEMIRLQVAGSTSSPLVVADLVSLDSDGFTINISTAPPSAYRVSYLALEGDPTNISIGSFKPSGSTGNQSVTGLGFQPDAVMFLWNGSDAATDPDTNHGFGLGMAVSSTERGLIYDVSDNSQEYSNCSMVQYTDSCICEIYYNDLSVNYKADFVSQDTGGFTINWSVAGDSADDIWYVAMKGGDYAVETATTQTSTGEWSITGAGFKPSAGIILSAGNAATGSVINGKDRSIGLVASSTERMVVNTMHQYNKTGQYAATAQDDGAVMKSYNNTTQAVIGAVDFASWDSDGLTLDQIDADASGKQILMFLFGPGASTGGSIIPLVMHHRRMQRIS